MRFGLKDSTIEMIQQVLAKYAAVEQAILYGSRAKGTYRNGSDIDLTLIGKDISSTLKANIWNEIDELPLLYSFDISCYHEITNTALLDHISRVGIIFYEKNREK